MGRDGLTEWGHKSLPPLPPRRGRAGSHNIITHLPGPKGNSKNVTSPTEAWKLFFPDSVIQKIMDYTNKWIETKKGMMSRERDAKPTNVQELKALIGLHYLASVMKPSHENLQDLWAKDGTGVEMFRAGMNRK